MTNVAPPLAGVVGWPISQSRSPALHGHWLKRYGIAGYYVPLGIAPQDFENGIRSLPRLGFRGVNITLPYKQTVLPLADKISDRAALIGAAQDRGAAFISDEIYHGIDYDRAPVTALAVSDDVCVINSFSKYFSMTGWRIGWMVVPEAIIRTVERLAQNMFICPPHASQVAALASMDATQELEANKAVYAENRRLMIEGLPRAGFANFAPPDGAFYIYADVSDLTDDALALSREILDRAGVAVTPGLDFDPQRGHRTLRFSYARSTADIVEGLARLADWRASR